MNTCILCGAQTEPVCTPQMYGVTSDGRPWPSYGNLLWCAECGHVQKETGASWKEAIDTIYRSYTTYAIAGSQDQQVFLGDNCVAVPRFHALIQKLALRLNLRTHGSLLDFGCGDGNFLQAFSTFFPHWDLYGHEYGVEHEAKVLAVDSVRAFSHGAVGNVKGAFDGVSMQHVLEHMLDPRAVLHKLVQHIDEDGWFFTQLPTFWNDPFELMIVDHCSHFTETALHNVLVDAQLENIQSTVGWIPKNIGFISRRTKKPQTKQLVDKKATYTRLTGCLHWLANFPHEIMKMDNATRLGIFGTSNAATWTASSLGGRVSFFVDEDPCHWGCTHLGLPILPPDQTGAGDKIFVAFAPSLAENIAARLNQSCAGEFFSIPWSLSD